MADIFLKFFNMSVSACWLVLAVVLLRVVLKKAPKWVNCIFWGIAGLRLVMPFSFESIFSLIPSAEFVPEEMIHSNTSVDVSGAEIFNYVGNNPVWYDLGVSDGSLRFTEFTAPDGEYINPLLIISHIASIVWIVGIAVLLIYTFFSFWRLKRKIRTAVLLRDNIYQSEAVASPFVLGIIKPKIYLPFNMNEHDMAHVIAHEQAHIRRKDHWWKPLGFAVLTLHWFNPLVWLGYVLLCRDIELACDEKVVKELNSEQRADYSQALLTCSVNRRLVAACPLAFGEVSVKDRVKSVLNYQKPAFWIVIVAVIASIVVSVCFLTNPAADRLANIEDHKLDNFLNERTVVMVSEGDTYCLVETVEDELLQELIDIRISSKGFSLSRDEDRDKTNTVILNIGTDGGEMITYFSGTQCIHFNSDFSEVWVDDRVKPTLSYKVKDPTKAKEIFESIAESAILDTNSYSQKITMSTYENVIDSTIFDIDGDGVDEQCVLTYGPTMGLYTVVFTATEVGSNEADYINTFNIPYTGDTEFYESADGELKIRCENYVYKNGESVKTEDIFLNITIENDNIVLKHGDKPVEYWGEQGITPADSNKKWNAINSAVSEAVIKNRVGKYSIDQSKPEKYPLAESFEAHQVMHSVTAKNDNSHTLTVYALTIYEEYNLEAGELVNLGGGASPVEIVLEVESETSYKLISYREINKPESIEDYLPEDYRDFDDGEIMENLAHSLKLDVNAYYGYIGGNDNSMIHEDPKTGLAKLWVTNEEMKQMFSAFENNNTENFEFEFETGFSRRIYRNGSFYYYCGYENRKDKVFIFFKGHEPQPVYILDFNNTFPEYKNEFGKNSKLYNKYYSMIMKIDI